MGNYGLQQIASTYQILSSTIGGNIPLFPIPLFPIFIDKKHITKTRNLYASKFKLLKL